MSTEVHGVIVEVQGGHVGLVSCPLCGCTLVIDGESDVVQAHSQWHLQQHVGGRRERTERRFDLGDRVMFMRSGVPGKVTDYWEEEGPLHVYTLRIASRLFFDVAQDELEALGHHFPHAGDLAAAPHRPSAA